jgi:hypothetical protein
VRFLHEKALLLSKLGRHQEVRVRPSLHPLALVRIVCLTVPVHVCMQVLNIYVAQLKSYEMAEAYCDDIWRQRTGASRWVDVRGRGGLVYV